MRRQGRADPIPCADHFRAGECPIDVVTRLRAAGCVFAEDEAMLLLEAACSPDELASMVDRRVAGEPLEYIVGWAEFCGLRIAVEPGVFVPRRRTEFLAKLAWKVTCPDETVVDLCCGTGAVGAFIKSQNRCFEVYAADIDPAAVRCARRNLPSASVYEGDLYDALPTGFRGLVDVIVANAPYVPTDEISMMPSEARDHEARVALDGGTDGLAIQRRIAAGALEWLSPDGRVLIETSVRQAPHTERLLADIGLTTRVERSEEVEGTVVVGCRQLRSASAAGQ